MEHFLKVHYRQYNTIADSLIWAWDIYAPCSVMDDFFSPQLVLTALIVFWSDIYYRHNNHRFTESGNYSWFSNGLNRKITIENLIPNKISKESDDVYSNNNSLLIGSRGKWHEIKKGRSFWFNKKALQIILQKMLKI